MEVATAIALTVGLPLIIVIWALLKFRGTTGSIKNGVPASAVIQSIAETGMTITSPSVGPEAPVYELGLLVTPIGGGAPYLTTSKHAIPRIAAPMIVPGRTIGVLVDPRDPQHVVPDWQRVDAGPVASPIGTATGAGGVAADGGMDLDFDANGAPNLNQVAAFAAAARSGAMPTRRGSAAQILATGTHGTATVTSAMPLGETVGQVNPTADPATLSDPVWVFTLEVQLAGQAPFPAVFGHRVPAAKVALVAPGIKLAVAVNEANRNQEVAIDWEKSPIGAV